MNAKQIAQAAAALLLAGTAFYAIAEDGSSQPAVETQPIKPADAQSQALESPPAITPVKADDTAASSPAENNAPAAADVPAAKPNIIQRAVKGISGFIDDVKDFFTGK
ncbi:MAG TPA: hypothetical protein VF816_13920 [Rhodocyclaceae bacterium]